MFYDTLVIWLLEWYSGICISVYREQDLIPCWRKCLSRQKQMDLSCYSKEVQGHEVSYVVSVLGYVFAGRGMSLAMFFFCIVVVA